MKTILAPVDFSSATDSVVTEAIRLARAFQARIEILYVLPTPLPGTGWDIVAGDCEALAKSAAEDADQRLRHLAATHRLDYAPVSTHRLVGNTVEQICARARELKAPYIVVGSHGHGAVYELLVGSTTSALLKQAPCPLVVVGAVRTVVAKPAFEAVQD